MKSNVNRFVTIFMALAFMWVAFSAVELKLEFDAQRTVIEIIVIGCVSALINYLLPKKRDRNIIKRRY